MSSQLRDMSGCRHRASNSASRARTQWTPRHTRAARVSACSAGWHGARPRTTCRTSCRAIGSRLRARRRRPAVGGPRRSRSRLGTADARPQVDLASSPTSIGSRWIRTEGLGVKVIIGLAVVAVLAALGTNWLRDKGEGLPPRLDRHGPPGKVEAHPWSPVKNGKSQRAERVSFQSGSVTTRGCQAAFGTYTVAVNHAFTFTRAPARAPRAVPGGGSSRGSRRRPTWRSRTTEGPSAWSSPTTTTTRSRAAGATDPPPSLLVTVRP